MRRTLRTAKARHPSSETASRLRAQRCRDRRREKKAGGFAHNVKADRLSGHIAGPRAGCRRESVTQSRVEEKRQIAAKGRFQGDGKPVSPKGRITTWS